jgi:hypothetical protein
LGIVSTGIVGMIAVAVGRAAPPTQVEDSFFTISVSGPDGNLNNEMFYLGSDGSLKLLFSQDRSGINGPESYQPSQSGTYTYVTTPSVPNTATLTTNLAGPPVAYTLHFTNDTSGTALENGFALGAPPFSFLFASPNTYLANVSNHVALRPSDAAITGFAIQGSSSRLVLIRSVGPTLERFGVTSPSKNPQFSLFSGTGTSVMGQGQPWDSVTGYDAQAMDWIFAIVGAFSLQSGSNDVAFFGLLAPGTYTVQTSDSTTPATGGSALTEVYILPYSG